MILFDLKCENEHLFEAWFPSNSKYEEQVLKNLVVCPYCNTTKVKKAPMAPNINLKNKLNKEKSSNSKNFSKASYEKEIKKFKKFIEKNTENVGNNFAEEARKIYYGETKSRAIRGKTNEKEAKELTDEGIPFSNIPWTTKEDA